MPMSSGVAVQPWIARQDDSMQRGHSLSLLPSEPSSSGLPYPSQPLRSSRHRHSAPARSWQVDKHVIEKCDWTDLSRKQNKHLILQDSEVGAHKPVSEPRPPGMQREPQMATARHANVQGKSFMVWKPPQPAQPAQDIISKTEQMGSKSTDGQRSSLAKLAGYFYRIALPRRVVDAECSIGPGPEVAPQMQTTVNCPEELLKCDRHSKHKEKSHHSHRRKRYKYHRPPSECQGAWEKYSTSPKGPKGHGKGYVAQPQAVCFVALPTFCTYKSIRFLGLIPLSLYIYIYIHIPTYTHMYIRSIFLSSLSLYIHRLCMSPWYMTLFC